MRVLRVDGSFEGWREARPRPPRRAASRRRRSPSRRRSSSGCCRATRRMVSRGGPRPRPAGSGDLPFAGAEGRVPPGAVALGPPLSRPLADRGSTGGRMLQDPSDEDVIALERMADAVRRDVDRVRALVRFRRVAVDGPTSGTWRSTGPSTARFRWPPRSSRDASRRCAGRFSRPMPRRTGTAERSRSARAWRTTSG